MHLHFLLCFGVLFTLASVVKAQNPPSETAVEVVLKAWDQHRIVAVGELHRFVQDKEFFLELITAPKFAGKVNDVVIEFGNALHQSYLDRYMEGKRVDPAALRRVWADTTVVNGLWNAPIYQQLLTGIREHNRKLPKQHRLRVLACDPPIDWSRVQSLEDAAPHLDRDSRSLSIFDNIEKQ